MNSACFDKKNCFTLCCVVKVKTLPQGGLIFTLNFFIMAHSALLVFPNTFLPKLDRFVFPNHDLIYNASEKLKGKADSF